MSHLAKQQIGIYNYTQMPSSIPVAYPRLTSLNCFLFCFRNSMIDNMREIEKCKAHVQDVEVPLEVFE